HSSFEATRFEYQQLRDEILQDEVLVTDTLKTTLTLAGAAITVALSEFFSAPLGRGFILYLGELIAVIGLRHIAHIQLSIHIIGSYLREFLEKAKSDVPQWERRSFHFRKTFREKEHMGAMETIRHSYWTQLLLVA